MFSVAGLIGESPGIVAIQEKIERLLRRQSESRRLSPILILGETGTGKGLVARAIHRAGSRSDGPFVDISCAAIPETLLEAELFGFERGAFTDARQAKPGLFQTAHGGTIFLDEVGLLPEGLQAKLLKVIEERAVRRLGSTRNDAVDVWILAATSEDLAEAARQRRFREDLYHRLAVLTLWLPPLRERGEDILLLAEHFLARACADYRLPPKRLAPDAPAALVAYRWPGNIRELSNVMERVALLSEEPVVTVELLGLPEGGATEPWEPGRVEPTSLEDAMGGVERGYLLKALRETSWNISRAAARLGISRSTLRYRIEKHGLKPGEPTVRPRRRAERLVSPAPAAPGAVRREGVAPASVRWEQRRLTLLRAALAVPRGTDLSPEASRQVSVLVEKVQSFGGRVEELSPSGIVAAFGLEPVEDAPRRAVHAAMAIQKAAEHARRDDAEALAVRIGIHVGHFLVGQTSGAVQIDLDAKRQAWSVLEALAAGGGPDTIWVSAAAVPFLKRRFELMAVGRLEQELGEVYQLVERERVGFGPGGRVTRFVGRHHELELLRSGLASAMRGQGQVVGIVGEAGIGKSRLLFEFRQGLRGEPVTYLEGRCVSHGSSIPYLPVLEMLRSNCRVTEMDSGEVIAEKVAQSLKKIGIEARESAPYLLRLLGVKEGTERLAELSPEVIQSRTFEILRQISLKGSQQRPLVLAVEDLHWIDKASEAYFTSLGEDLAVTPVLLVVTYRPGYRPPWTEKSYTTQISLQPLSPEDSLSVVQSVIEPSPLPESVARLILAKAEGNPFFLEELALAVREQTDLLRPTLAVPDTIQEVLLARINRLPEEPRRLLQTASILGREVSLRLLAALWEGPGELEPHLRELTRLEFLYEKTGGDEPLCVFKHPLTQEVAYESLLPSHRQAFHAAAGRALESLYADRLDEASDRLAYHYSRTEDAAKAVQNLTRLAEKAARGYAHEEAVRALEEALVHAERLAPQERDRRVLDLILRIAHSLSFLGRFPESLDLLLHEQERLERLQDPSLSSPYYFWLGHTYSYLGIHERAIQNVQRSLREAARSGDKATMGKAHVVLAQESYWSGEPLEGVERGRRAVELLERAGEQWWLGLAHWVVGINYVVIGAFRAALEAEARALAVGEAVGDPRLQSYAAWSSGWIHALTGEPEAGIEACKLALSRSPDPVNTAVVLGHLGYAYLEQGDLARAIPLLEQAVAEMRRFRFQRLLGRFITFLGEAHLMNGQRDKAHALVSQGLEITKEAKYWYAVGWAQLALGRILQASGFFALAEGHLGAALETFASIQARFMTARTRLALAELAHARENREAASTHLREAHQLFTALQVPRYVERAEQLGGRWAFTLAVTDRDRSLP